MKITYEKKIDTIARAEYTITVFQSEIRDKLNDFLNNISPHIHIPGFRKGNAPKQTLIKTIGENRITDELKPRIQHEAFNQLLDSINAKPVGPPGFTDGSFSFDADYVFDVDFAKEVKKLNPSHDHHMPIAGDLSGSPMQVYEKLHGDKVTQTSVSQHLPDDISQSMPDYVTAQASTKLSDLKNPLKALDKNKPQPGETDTADRLAKTTTPDDMIPDQPHAELDKKTEPPTHELNDKLPDTSQQPDTDIKQPETDDHKTADELTDKIDSPSPSDSNIEIKPDQIENKPDQSEHHQISTHQPKSEH